jgi:CDP-diacylglycerol--glycerol-3-phosphate 3-phosphatidyltransferase
VAKTEPKQPSKQYHDELTFNNTPNILTLIRMGLVPIVVFLLYQRTENYDLAAALVFTVASITDYFDGYLARVNKMITVYGKLMDPLADKFLVICSLIALQELGRLHSVVVMLLICRELAITGLRALASAEGVIIAASSSAKWKTATQMVGIPLMMKFTPLFGLPSYKIGEILIYSSLAISLWSAGDYIWEFFKGVQKKAKLKRQQRLAAKKPTRN